MVSGGGRSSGGGGGRGGQSDGAAGPRLHVGPRPRDLQANLASGGQAGKAKSHGQTPRWRWETLLIVVRGHRPRKARELSHWRPRTFGNESLSPIFPQVTSSAYYLCSGPLGALCVLPPRKMQTIPGTPCSAPCDSPLSHLRPGSAESFQLHPST